jgi:6-methylsalicylic acid synthase
VAAREHEEIWGGIVDLAPGWSPTALRRLLHTTPHEDVISLCGRAAAVARLARVDRPPVAGEVRCRPEATYLITGGLGVLGLEVAQWLAGRGARRIVLAGRRALAPRDTWDTVTEPDVMAQIGTVVALEALGVTVRILALDISDRDQAVKLLNPAELGLPPIAGIVHAAGVLDNRMLLDVDEESLRQVMQPKVTGAWVLHELFPPGSLDFLVLFSSAGQLLGLTGQASYAAANAFLDALAIHRGADTISFGWTSWRGLGMSTSSAVIDLELDAAGTAAVSAADALRCWEFAERQRGRYFAVLRVLPPEPGVSRLPLLSALTFEEQSQVADSGPQWTNLARDELRRYVSDQVCQQVAVEMRLSPDELDARKPLAEMGVDSVMTVAIRRKLEKRLRRGLPTTLFWNHPTISAVIDYLVQRLGAEDNDET